MAKLATVFGASGFLGRHVVRELTTRGWRVRAAVRRPHLAEYLQVFGVPGTVQLFQANVRHRRSVEDAVAGADAVVNLVGLLGEVGKNTFDGTQRDGARIVAESAADAGVRDLVHVSAIGADADSDSDYARTKGEAERLVAEVFPEAVILRPSIVFGPQDAFFNRFAGIARLSPALPLIGGGKTRFQPVYVDDVADAVAAAVTDPAHRGKTFELGGPEVMTFKELMQLTLHVTGRRRALVPLPFPIAGLVGQAGDLAAKLPFVQAPLSADQVKLLKRDNVVGETGKVGTFADLGITPTAMDAVLPSYLYRYRKHGQFSPEVAL
ncbi:complex I NDUFA9 subunit family protein [Parvularcula dongshanensis]|uniref:NADH dehydrogenase n=1 Tax=Parvularcula dongshanensis TaxID=1173995 RepID=A0A840I2E9_9PROT|nr:complex I NDUFA9 subunit family protein [Parvularcula dongshanensis]MBB4658368.1 NADH dehydrogenase [Parvularcula dongshanensis]